MPIIDLKLPSGEVIDYEYPDHFTDAQLEAQIAKDFPIEDKKKEKQERPHWSEVLKESLKQLHPEIHYAEEVEKARQTPTGKALELPLFLAAPELEIPGLAGLLSKGIPKGSQYLTKAIQTALPQAGVAGGLSALSGESPLESSAIAGGITAPLSLMSQAISSGSPLLRNISRLGLVGSGLGLGYAGGKALGGNYGGVLGGLLGGLAAGHGVLPSSRAKSKVFGHGELGDIEQMREKVEAAKRLGLSHLTPAEASGSEAAGSVEGALKRLPGSGKIIREAKKERLGSEQKAIEDLMETTFPQSLTKEKGRLYEEAGKDLVPAQELNRWKNNEIYKTAEKKIQKDAALREKAKGLDKNSIEYQNIIKKSMDNMHSSAVGKEPESAKIIKDTRKDFLNFLDDFSPSYKEARGLGQRSIFKQKFSDFFNTRDLTGANFHKFLKNKKNYENIQNNLKMLRDRAPNAERAKEIEKVSQSLIDMKKVFPDLIGTQTARSASKLTETSMSKSRESLDAFKHALKEVFPFLSTDKQVAKLITSPNWIEEYEKYLRNQKSWKTAGELSEKLSKGLAGYESQKKNKE